MRKHFASILTLFWGICLNVWVVGIKWFKKGLRSSNMQATSCNAVLPCGTVSGFRWHVGQSRDFHEWVRGWEAGSLVLCAPNSLFVISELHFHLNCNPVIAKTYQTMAAQRGRGAGKSEWTLWPALVFVKRGRSHISSRRSHLADGTWLAWVGF